MAPNTLHVFILPLLAPGHMLPMVDMAKQFAERGVKATIVTTPGNAARMCASLDRVNAAGGQSIQLLQVPFPSSVAGLPDSYDSLTASRVPDVTPDFFRALTTLRQPFERLLRDHRPDCIISDCFYPWTADVAAEYGIPRLVFHGTSAFSLSVTGTLLRSNPHQAVSGDDEAFSLPELPDAVRMTRSQLPGFILSPPDYMAELGTSHLKSYGVVVNSFRELEPGYAAGVAAGLKAWYIGPVSLCNREATDKAARGEEAALERNQRCLDWLEAQAPGSVLYVCFGSLPRFTRAQVREIALGLEAAGHPFLWVVREPDQEGLPEGFEERTSGGLVWRGWAPQVLILGHEAVGGFVTHCGWNSTLEGICAGLPMATWPLFAEQFINEKLVVQVLRVGVAVGAALCSTNEEERTLVRRERIGEAVARVMGVGEEAEAMRKRARELAAMARNAVEEGGSSHEDLRDLIQELTAHKSKKQVEEWWCPLRCFPEILFIQL